MPMIDIPFLDLEEHYHHEECSRCGYWWDGKCHISTALDPFEKPTRDVNACLSEAWDRGERLI